MPDINDCLKVFFVSLLPILELRASIPAGYAMGMSFELNYIISVIGNFLPVPFILLFVRSVIGWMKNCRVKIFRKTAGFIETKARKNSDKILKYATWGLLLFVAIPLPTTGAWTGALVAALFEIRMRKALPLIFAGVLIAGAVVSVAVYGGVGVLSWAFSHGE